jgi:hypothetical protein
MTMPEHQSTNEQPSRWQAGASRLTILARDLVGYTIEEVERELILESLDQYCGSRTYTANVLGISIRCLRNKITQYAALGMAVPPPGLRGDNISRHTPDCVSCGRPMWFERAIPSLGRSSESQKFQCGPCGLAVTAVDRQGADANGNTEFARRVN